MPFTVHTSRHYGLFFETVPVRPLLSGNTLPADIGFLSIFEYADALDFFRVVGNAITTASSLAKVRSSEHAGLVGSPSAMIPLPLLSSLRNYQTPEPAKSFNRFVGGTKLTDNWFYD